MVASTESTLLGAASVATPAGPIGQSELSMSMVCWARRPGGVTVSIRRCGLAALADGVGEDEHPGVSVRTSAAAAVSTVARRSRLRRRLVSRRVPCNVEHNLEFQ